ncbi:MAG TPA: hypothetical protein PK718_08260 [Candidatus Methanofastidiosa archaeon]|nr:hypothetical protein [Candidatus Methanofastidiosa archaeon]HPR42517.1 hypothetical protein [Candidatus Methanofastidiosa archaeon]
MTEDDLSKRIESAAEKIGKDIEDEFKDIDFEKKMDDLGNNIRDVWNEKFGIIGPALTSIIGFAALSFFIYVFKYSGIYDSGVAYDIASMLENYFKMIVALMFVFNYGNYFADRTGPKGKLVKPLLGATSFTISIWFLSKALFILDAHWDVSFIGKLAGFTKDYYLLFFFLYLAIGYVHLFLSGILEEMDEET